MLHEFATILIKISSLNLIQFWHPLCYFYLTLGLFVLIWFEGILYILKFNIV